MFCFGELVLNQLLPPSTIIKIHDDDATSDDNTLPIPIYTPPLQRWRKKICGGGGKNVKKINPIQDWSKDFISGGGV